MIKNNTKKMCLFAVEVVVSLFLLVLAIYKGMNPVSYDVDLSNAKSDYMTYSGNVWSIPSSSQALDKPVSLISINDVSLPIGSYTFVIQYASDKQLKCQLSSPERNVFIHADKFNLNRNKSEVDYDFYITKDINDIRITVSDYTQGSFELQKAWMVTNNHDYMVLWFSCLLFFLVLNICVFSPWYKNNKRLINMLLTIALVATVPELMNGIAYGHDMGFQLVRIEGIAQGLQNGEFPVAMNAVFNDSYGYPVDIFYPNLLLYIPALFRIIGFSIVTSYKIYILMINILTVCVCFLMGKGIFDDEV